VEFDACSILLLWRCVFVPVQDPSLTALARLPALRHLDIGACYYITDDGVAVLVQQSTDRSVVTAAGASRDEEHARPVLPNGSTVARAGSPLEYLGVRSCNKLTLSVFEMIARSCPKLHTLLLGSVADLQATKQIVKAVHSVLPLCDISL